MCRSGQRLPVKYLFLLLLVGCAEKWKPADATTASDVLADQQAIQLICYPDAGTCNPAQVRALSDVSVCGLTSMLYRHGLVSAEAGANCQK
jgi:hypothetical protein